MGTKNGDTRALSGATDEFEKSEGGLTAAEIALAYKATLSDFVRQKTSRQNTAEVTSLLAGALAARKQELAERDDLSSMRVRNFF